MAVLCSHCGEELMGAVNRCWKCGKPIQSHSGPCDVPPIRRSPITGPLNAPLEAMVLEEPLDREAAPPDNRRGSPFETDATISRVSGASPSPATTPPPPSTTPQKTKRQPGPDYAVTQFASIAAVGLGILAWGVSFRIPIATVCIALFAIGLGVWGLFGYRRGVAIFALLLSCSALAWGAFGSLVQIYQMIYGVHPFAVG